ncbi:mannitol dehydrogenase [Candidatus Sodalis endolongispinus]|uniref:Mannitol dehydrogenase n=1 Tax=Candidatus Sodalis endolongispinus TaxID=2812662 RepID=A0ABS5YBA8_9GAMM|nr:mannitol dehydrogenase [Candidatus Sodalis endolongispinus]MBT9431987.1 mannitol dehydrogenase [Candidatus Sodalis endolongispinus]
MQAVHFGAGSIGRGFIGDLLHDGGYDITFVENNDALNTQIKQYKGYDIWLIEKGYQRKFIPVANALSPVKDRALVVQKITEADLITTAVWADNLRHIAPLLLEGLQARRAAGKNRINIIVCENARFNGELLKKEIAALGEPDVDALAAFPSTAVDRMVLASTRNQQQSIDAGVDYELVIDKTKLIAPAAQPLPGAVYTDNLQQYMDRKLYIINGGHAWAGYMGHLQGYVTMQQIFADDALVDAIRQSMRETARLLSVIYGFSVAELDDYIRFVINRFRTPGVVDTVQRVCRSLIRKLSAGDRLTGPCLQCEEKGLPNDLLIKGIAAALRYNDPDDEQSVILHRFIADHDISRAISHFTGIQESSDLHNKIMKSYAAVDF